MSGQNNEEKRLAAQAAVDLIESGMVVGLGSGSTSLIAVELLGERVRGGLKMRGIPTSRATRDLALQVGIPLVTLDEATRPDIDIDGADEVDENLNLIKGGGGALFHEKVIAYAARRFVVMVDSSKLVGKLGKFHLPVEVIPFASSLVREEIESLGAKPSLRKGEGDKPFVTDEGNWIFDCDFGSIEDPGHLAARLAAVPGIVEHGLFVDMTDIVLVGENGRLRQLS